jgi:hypothetical protein
MESPARPSIPGKNATSHKGEAGLHERSKAPKFSPRATNSEIVGKIIYLRQNYHFGPQKIAMY